MPERSTAINAFDTAGYYIVLVVVVVISSRNLEPAIAFNVFLNSRLNYILPTQQLIRRYTNAFQLSEFVVDFW